MGWMQTHPLNQTKDLTKLEKASLVAHFAHMPDPRINRRKEHDLVDILVAVSEFQILLSSCYPTFVAFSSCLPRFLRYQRHDSAGKTMF